MIISVTLPNVAFSKPPIWGPERAARSSVAWPIMAGQRKDGEGRHDEDRLPVGAWVSSSTIATGTKTSSHSSLRLEHGWQINVVARSRAQPQSGTVRSASLRRAAAAIGSGASVIARTTTMRRAPASMTGRGWSRSMPPMANQGSVHASRCVPHEVESRGGATRFRWGLVNRADGDVVETRAASAVASTSAGAWVDRPTIPSRKIAPARHRCGRSFWPTCTPSAPSASATSGRSLRMNGIPASRHASSNGPPDAEQVAGLHLLLPKLDQVDARVASSPTRETRAPAVRLAGATR